MRALQNFALPPHIKAKFCTLGNMELVLNFLTWPQQDAR